MREIETLTLGNSTVVICSDGSSYHARLFTNTRGGVPRFQWSTCYQSWRGARLSGARAWAKKTLEAMQ